MSNVYKHVMFFFSCVLYCLLQTLHKIMHMIDGKWESAKKGKMLQKEFYKSSGCLAGVGRPLTGPSAQVYAGLHMV